MLGGFCGPNNLPSLWHQIHYELFQSRAWRAWETELLSAILGYFVRACRALEYALLARDAGYQANREATQYYVVSISPYIILYSPYIVLYKPHIVSIQARQLVGAGEGS